MNNHMIGLILCMEKYKELLLDKCYSAMQFMKHNGLLSVRLPIYLNDDINVLYNGKIKSVKVHTLQYGFINKTWTNRIKIPFYSSFKQIQLYMYKTYGFYLIDTYGGIKLYSYKPPLYYKKRWQQEHMEQ